MEDSAEYISCKGDNKVGRRNDFLQEIVRRSPPEGEVRETEQEKNKIKPATERTIKRSLYHSEKKSVCFSQQLRIPFPASVYEQHIFAVVTVRPVE